MRGESKKDEGARPRDGGSLEERLESCLPRLSRHLGAEGRAGAAEPDDLAQEVAVRALTYRDSFDPTRALWPWLKRLARNVRLDQVRRAAREERVEDAEHRACDAPAHTAALEARDELARALSHLSAVERDVLLRFHQRGMSVAAIAAELGHPEGTIKSHLHRARRRLAAEGDGGGITA